ncbi:MAG: YbhB/YbcL family Raf kinase inhibitor-like protein [Candidatus Nanopelagicales bacterium]
MKLTSSSITPDQRIPERYAMGKADPDQHATFSDNVSPQLSWSDPPAGTKSFAVIMHDESVPTVGTDVNVEGKVLTADLPRTDFYHWVLIDIAPEVSQLSEGAHATGVTVRGKKGPEGPDGTRHGINSYREFFHGDRDLGGDYFGYDGPFPPWNDEVVHKYTITVYALDVERLPVEGPFDGPAALAAMQDHVLDSASFSATYSIAS